MAKKNKSNKPIKVDGQRKLVIIKVPMRDLIVKRMKALNLSRYDMAKAVAGKMSDQAVYDFLNGKKDMASGRVWLLMQLVGLEVRVKADGPRPT